MEPQRTEKTTYRSGHQQVGAGLGKFLVDLAGFLTVQIVLSLADYFEFSKIQKDRLHGAEYPGQLMVDFLRERGIITRTDISLLITALEYLKLDGVRLEVLSSFQSNLPTIHQSSATGKLTQFQRFLKAAYELLYKAIQPIPYIRDKLFCVNDIFVEGGIELIDAKDKDKSAGASSSTPPRTRNKPLKSYRDIFNDDIIPSKRVIVEGEPGYGKSTLTLQAAYDWCEERSPSSALQGVELFILLPLRLLKGITSIYKAIKLFILSRDCNLSESEIKDIFDSCSSVVIVLDGYDEYPDIHSDLNSDIMEIIKGKMFTNFKLVLCTRSGYLPSYLDPRTVRVRLTGFDADARERYINMAVVGSSGRAKELKQNLQKNPIMSDICQVPLFFVIFAHMAQESKDIYKCDSVTSFFKYMIHCFYSHMWNKEEGNRNTSLRIAANTRRLYKVAFDGLAGDNQTVVWDKKKFYRKVGRKCFNELIKTGILIQETFLEINDAPNTSLNEYVKERKTVRFYHKLFAEWYAAHYLAERASSFFAFGLNKTFVKVNPLDLQFVFRFACGLEPSATKRIVNYLRGIEGGDPFATLCILEQTGGTQDILGVVNEMCSNGIAFKWNDNQLLQRSRIQLLNIATKSQIPIYSVSLDDGFQSVNLEEECLYFSSGLQMPRLDTLQELLIRFGDYEDLRDRARDVIDFSARCIGLKSLKFDGYVESMAFLPRSFHDADLLACLHRKNCKVEWYNYSGWFHLNLKTGQWENENGRQMTDNEYRGVADYFDEDI